MVNTSRRRRFVRWGMLTSVAIGIVGAMYFTTREEPVTGLVIAVLFGAGGYWEYRQRVRDLDQAEAAEPAQDPFERRERRR